MLAALRTLAESGLMPAQRTTFHFSNFEEVGHGASAGIPDDVAELIAVDMGALGEGLQGNEHAVSICAKDSGGPYDLGIRRRLVALAQAHDIPYKLDIYPFYGSDAEAALRAGGDYRIGLAGTGGGRRHTRSSARTATRWKLRRDYCWLICSRSDGARGRTPALALARSTGASVTGC